MITYELSNTFNLNHYDFYAQVPHLTRTIADSYDGHFEWLTKKFFPNLKNGTRGYSFAVDYNAEAVINTGISGSKLAPYLSGCALLKKEPEEKKICCLFIDPIYRKQGIASQLIKDSFQLLETEKPLMTVSEQNLDQLKPLLKRFGFELTSVKESVYKPGIKEYFYNEGLAR